MNRERALKVVMVLVGLLFSAAIYPVTMILWHRDQPSYEGAMGLSLYVTLGILLLIAVRNPSAHRSLIAFAAWSSFAHAAVMTVMVFRDARSRDRSEEHTSELQSQSNLVCRLLLEKKKKIYCRDI